VGGGRLVLETGVPMWAKVAVRPDLRGMKRRAAMIFGLDGEEPRIDSISHL
jgi:hypothetical protein